MSLKIWFGGAIFSSLALLGACETVQDAPRRADREIFSQQTIFITLEEGADVEQFLADTYNLESIDGVREVRVARPVQFDRPSPDWWIQGYAFAVFIEFESEDAVEIYGPHPLHRSWSETWDLNASYFQATRAYGPASVGAPEPLPQPKWKVIELDTPGPLHPEGIAVDAEKGRIFLNGVTSKQIIVADMETGTSKTLPSAWTGQEEGIGATITDEFVLFLTMQRHIPDGTPRMARLQVYDRETLAPLRSYARSFDRDVLFNDVTVTAEGVAYITDTRSTILYAVNVNDPSATIEVALDDNRLDGANGIDWSPKTNRLFIATSRGIQIFDLVSKSFVDWKMPPIHNRMDYSYIDGLRYHNSRLYTVQFGDGDGITVFNLDGSEGQFLSRTRILEDHPLFEEATTLQVSDGALYVLANTQWSTQAKIDAGEATEADLTGTYILAQPLGQ